MLLRLLKYILFAGLLVPSFAFASNVYKPVCADYTISGSVSSCTGTDSVSMSSNGFMRTGATSIGWVTPSITVYFSYVITTSSGGNGRICLYGTGNNACAADTGTNSVGTYTDVAVTVPSDFGTVLQFGGDTDSVSSLNFNSLCVADTAGLGCGAGSGSGTTTVATSTVTIIDNPTQDLFDAVFLFFISMFFIVWFFMNRFRLV